MLPNDRPRTHPFDDANGLEPVVEATFIPRRYEPNYAYPLLVMLHGRGGDEHQLIRHLPELSWRNYVGLGLRAPEPVVRKTGAPGGYSWGSAFARPRNRADSPPPTPPSENAEIVKAIFETGRADRVDLLEDAIFGAVRQTRRALHVHSERIFLVGCGEGAAVAYRLGLTYPERFAGVVAINGWIPSGFRPLARWSAARSLRILVVHGQWNARAPIEGARRDVGLLRSAGLRVSYQAYPCAHRLTGPLLADVDTWLINQCTAEEF